MVTVFFVPVSTCPVSCASLILCPLVLCSVPPFLIVCIPFSLSLMSPSSLVLSRIPRLASVLPPRFLFLPLVFAVCPVSDLSLVLSQVLPRSSLIHGMSRVLPLPVPPSPGPSCVCSVSRLCRSSFILALYSCGSQVTVSIPLSLSVNGPFVHVFYGLFCPALSSCVRV